MKTLPITRPIEEKSGFHFEFEPQNGDESGRIIQLPKLVPRVLIPVLLHKNLGKPGKDRGEILHSVFPHPFPKESPPKPDHGQLA